MCAEGGGERWRERLDLHVKCPPKEKQDLETVVSPGWVTGWWEGH